MRWFKKKTAVQDQATVVQAQEPAQGVLPSGGDAAPAGDPLVDTPSAGSDIAPALSANSETIANDDPRTESGVEPAKKRFSFSFKRKQATAADSNDESEKFDASTPAAGPGVEDDSGNDKKRMKRWSKRAPGVDKGRDTPRPIRVFIGYLPEVTERDALEYALGIAEKHFEQVGMAFFDAFKYAEGFAYEVHEGGGGKAFLPEIIKHFTESGPYTSTNTVSVIIQTATRMVEVQKLRDGLAAVILPESSTKEPTEWLAPTTSMQPALNKRTGFLVVAAALFTTGFIAMMVTSVLTRYQEYDPPPEKKIEYLNPATLPSSQWSNLERVPAGSYVKALRFKDGKWEQPEIVTDTAPAPAPVPALPAAPVTPAAETLAQPVIKG